MNTGLIVIRSGKLLGHSVACRLYFGVGCLHLKCWSLRKYREIFLDNKKTVKYGL